MRNWSASHDAGSRKIIRIWFFGYPLREGARRWRVRSQAVLIAIGIDWEGRRNVLAGELASRESASSWKDFLAALRERGLHGVQVAISDDHPGLKRAVGEVLPEATRQRCYGFRCEMLSLGDPVGWGVHGDQPDESIQGTALPCRCDPDGGTVVPSISVGVSARSELLAKCGLLVDASCIWRWVQAYAPESNERCRRHLMPTDKSYRIDETYIKVKGEDRYLYRAVDSAGQTFDFLLTARRDADSAKRFFRKVFSAEGNPMARVLNVDKNPVYAAAVRERKRMECCPAVSACANAAT